ncbi:MAG TPA: efflux transporter periplasmic adaptor subunit [Haliea salexigens]|uniref:Efflux transporter periplasmic adaptor subunit n=1 Tax=Haliea salexigens TaxID=287487 RepID=A0A3C1KK82_9GAMM|nr:efflux transporter periplasmic adaptor subunit [Haliea salexigens]|tara:strand:+ start:15073 stop:16206 length:1134 start_codon:yes stop_codon:yes gene_type:complete
MSKKKFLFGLRMWLMLLVTLLVFGGLFGMQWFGNKKMNEFMDNMPVQPATVTAMEAGTALWRDSVESVGTLVAIRGAELATEVPGTVETIHFDNGAEVAAGAAILTLNSAPDRAQLEELQAAADLARQELERARRLVEQRNISESELDQRVSLLQQAKARVAAQQARIEQKTLRAPYAGRLGIRRFNVGDYVQAGDTVIALQALDSLFVNFSLPEQYSQQVEAGMPVEARLEALDGRTFAGTVTAISPVVDPNTRNFALQATLPNPEELLRPGMFARLVLPIGIELERVVVPQTAIAYRPYGDSVYVIQEREGALQVSQRFVTLGPVRGDMVAVEEGLDPGERVATSGLLKLDGGMPVKIDNTSPPAAELDPQPDNG